MEKIIKHKELIRSITKVKSNIQIMSLMSFFVMCLSLYNNYIGFGVFYLLVFLAFQLLLFGKSKEEWETSKDKIVKGNKNLLKFFFYGILINGLIFFSYYFLLYFCFT